MAKGDKGGATEIDFSKRKLKVMGTIVEANQADTELSGDTSKDMVKTPGMIAFWSAVHASALHEEIQVDAAYRNWRAKAELKIVAEGKPSKKGAEVKKPTLDDIKRLVESDDTFVKLKGAQGEAAHNVALSKGMVTAYDKRSNLLQSTGATKRTELEKLGVVTPAEPVKGKRGKAAAKPDPTPDIDEDDDEEDDDFEEDEDEEIKEEADEEEDDDLEEVDDDEDEEEDEKPKGKAAKGAKGKAGKGKAKPKDDDEDEEDDEDEAEETDDEEEEVDDDEDDEGEDDEPPPRRAKKAGKKAGKKKATRKK